MLDDLWPFFVALLAARLSDTQCGWSGSLSLCLVFRHDAAIQAAMQYPFSSPIGPSLREVWAGHPRGHKARCTCGIVAGVHQLMRTCDCSLLLCLSRSDTVPVKAARRQMETLGVNRSEPNMGCCTYGVRCHYDLLLRCRLHIGGTGCVWCACTALPREQQFRCCCHGRLC